MALLCDTLPNILRKFVADDAFYYLQAVWQSKLGHPLSFDGIHPTNGFHPLYFFLLRGLSSFVPDKDLFVYLAMTVNILLFSGSAFFYWMSRSKEQRTSVLFGLLFFCLNPILFLSSLSGVETDVQIPALLFLLSWIDRLVVEKHPLFLSSLLVTSFLFALCYLARSDAIFLIIACWISLFYRSDRNHLIRLLAIPAFSLLIILPWLIISFQTTGHFSQDSMRALTHQQSVTGLNSEQISSYFIQLAKACFISLPLAATILTTTVLCFIRHDRLLSRKRIILPFSAIVVTNIFYAVSLPHYQYWYYTISIVVLAHYLPEIFRHCTTRIKHLPGNKIVPATIIVVLIVTGGLPALATVLSLEKSGVYPWQGFYIEAIHRSEQSGPETTTIGAFNSGIFGYFAARSTVVNLDGVMNNSILSALESRELLHYLQSNGITRILDHQNVIFELFNKYEKRPCSLRIIEQYPTPGPFGDLLLIDPSYERVQ